MALMLVPPACSYDEERMVHKCYISGWTESTMGYEIKVSINDEESVPMVDSVPAMPITLLY